MSHRLVGMVCPHCKLYNELSEFQCRRCGKSLSAKRGSLSRYDAHKFTLLRTLLRIALLAAFFLTAWYASLLKTSAPLLAEQRQAVERAITILQQRGFSTEATMLRRVVTFRSTDHWWNYQFGHPQAYAATNFPFEVITLYPDFFSKTVDDTERAVILLHESYHLRGQGEETAYAETWRAKEKLGYNAASYGTTRVWSNMRDDTLTYVPGLFRCGASGQEDCVRAGREVMPSTGLVLTAIQRE
ncbi:MAG TPA: hypothetical protein VFZ34_02685 [Blastocatellia bacterium]|nr:hypothetical protein [Blastocatellia bacterium]